MNHASMRRMEGKRILVTGAGGSIGSALARALAPAARLILLDHSEFALYELDRHFRNLAGVRAPSFVLGGCGDQAVLSAVFATHRPEMVFHAAAFKHVPLLEENVFAAMQNNVLGTYSLVESALAHGVKEFVQVSTDKAVDPSSIMGVSKRICELLLIAHSAGATRMSAVRLANVWASQGSVVNLFLEQIAKGGPVTVTDPDVSRFFMTMEEAVNALFAALEPRSSGTVLVPYPGEPVRILDLAQRLLREHQSLAPIQFIGLRPGDKLSESLISSRETLVPEEAASPSALRAVLSPAPAWETLLHAMSALRHSVATSDRTALLDIVRSLVPEYSPRPVRLDPAAAEPALEESAA
jgi:FlaA1/EpsC-like NDP-sugar epimerase